MNLSGKSAQPYVYLYIILTRKTWLDQDGQLEQNDRQDTL
jgi:hypothetical protein